MLGLFSTLQLGARSLQTAQMGVKVTGHNLANVNNPAYDRQRVIIQTNFPVPSLVGPQGTGALVVAIQQLRSELVDGQIRGEQSVGGYWAAQQSALQFAQAWLGEFLDRNADSVNSAVTAGGAGGFQGLAGELSGLFNAFQSVATSPTSLSERMALISQAQSLATRFNQISHNLSELGKALDASLDTDVNSANQLLAEIAQLNGQIGKTELANDGTANDLRDLREQKLESLAKLVDIQTSTATDGAVNVTIGGVQMVSSNQELDTLQTYDAGGGQMLVRSTTSATPLALAGGTIQGTIDARDGALVFLVLHESSHALFDLLSVPLLGHEEDAADSVAAWMLLRAGREAALRSMRGAAWMYLRDSRARKADESDFVDVHALDAQRYYNVLCLAYGSDPEFFGAAVKRGRLPQERAEGCEEEWSQVNYAVKALLLGHVDAEAADRVRARYQKKWGERLEGAR